MDRSETFRSSGPNRTDDGSFGGSEPSGESARNIGRGVIDARDNKGDNTSENGGSESTVSAPQNGDSPENSGAGGGSVEEPGTDQNVKEAVEGVDQKSDLGRFYDVARRGDM